MKLQFKRIILVLPTVLLICITTSAYAQQNEWHIHKTVKDGKNSTVHIKIDTVLGDTLKKSGLMETIVAKDGIVLSEIHPEFGIRKRNSLTGSKSGYAIKRHRNGLIKEQGSYYVGNKTGTWTYYFYNGTLAKVEQYDRAYPEVFTQNIGTFPRLENRYLKQGPYLEYYSNGQLKAEGGYEIVEVFSTTDSIPYSFDPETYKTVFKQIEGEFWHPLSIKSGTWKHYDEKGNLLSTTNHKYSGINHPNTRPIEYRYIEFIENYDEAAARKKQELDENNY